MSQTLQSVLCITTNKYLVRVLVVLLHACFSVVSPIPFLLAAIFFPGHPYIGSTTVLPDTLLACKQLLKIMAVLATVSTLHEQLPSVIVDLSLYYCCTAHQPALCSLCTEGCA